MLSRSNPGTGLARINTLSYCKPTVASLDDNPLFLPANNICQPNDVVVSAIVKHLLITETPSTTVKKCQVMSSKLVGG